MGGNIIACVLFLLMIFQATTGVTKAPYRFSNQGFGEENNTFYLSNNGTDTSTCGSTIDTACKTLEHVLSLYYNTTHQPQPRLNVMTSKSLRIDQRLMDKYTQFRSSELQITSIFYERLDSNSAHPTVYINDVDFLVSDWNFANINVKMINSDSSMLSLSVQSAQVNQTFQLNVNFKNCTLGSARFESIANISILNSHIIDDHYLGMKIVKSTVSFKTLITEGCNSNNTLITLSKSDGSILYSTFVNNQAEALILVTEKSSLMVANSSFLTNTLSPNSGAFVIMDSYCQIENTFFESNTGRALFVKDKARLHVTDLAFINNSAEFGSAIVGMTLVKMTLQNSIFTSNTAGSGGTSAHNIGSDVKLSPHVSRVMKYLLPTNTTKSSYWFQSYGGAIACLHFCRLMISDCTFNLNNAEKEGGAIAAGNNSEVAIENSTFYNNSAQGFGGALFIILQSTGILKNLLFAVNSAKKRGGGVFVANSCSINIRNIQFIGNQGYFGAGGMYAQFDVHVFIYGSKFIDNISPYGDSGGILQNLNTTLQVKDSFFQNNSAHTFGGCLAVGDGFTGKLTNVTFYQNSGSVVYSGPESSVTITKCSFIKNEQAIVSTGENGTLDVTHSTFIQNSEHALVGQMTTITLLNVTFDENETKYSGAALYFILLVNVTMNDCIFRDNTAYMEGAALLVSKSASISMHNCRFMGNKAQKKDGGAISIEDSVTLNMTSCILENNTSGNDAGAISITAGSEIAMLNCTLNGNRADLQGGALSISNSNLTLTDTIFRNNSAGADSGGGIIAWNRCVIKITNSIFTNNTALNSGYGGAIKGSKKIRLLVHNGTFISNHADAEGGAIYTDRNSTIILKDSKFYNNYADSGALHIDQNCTLVTYNCTFKGNRANEGACISMIIAEAYFTNCTIENNVANSFGGAVTMQKAKLRIASTLFLNNSAPNGKDIFLMNDLIRPTSSEILTYQSIFKHDNITVRTTDTHFQQEALETNIIQDNGIEFAVIETPYASVVPKECDFRCECYYSPIHEANIFNCSNTNLTHLPDTVLNGTNWLIASGNNLNQMVEVKQYMNEIVHLDISNNVVNDIAGDVLENVLKNSNYLNIAKNSLKQLPKEIAKATNDTELWIGNNPYDCNCDMIWMRDWILGAPKVMDKENARCATGKMIGTPIHKLSNEAMGCGFPLWVIITISIAAVTIIAVIIIINRKWEAIKFRMFIKYNILINDDGPENLDEMEFDAFITYSHHDRPFVKTEVLEYLEKEFGFKLCVHERDFTVGDTIPANIEVAIKHSRRMIMVISRNYIHSEWCIFEFRIAHQLVAEGKKKFLIPLLLEDVNPNELEEVDADLKLYIETHTYTDCKDLAMMKKKLTYAMPRVPLVKHRQQALADNADGPNEVVEALRGAAAGLVNNVGIMTRRIGEAERKKKRAYRPPPERPLGGDIETSDSDEDANDDSDESNDDEERPLLR